MDDVQSQRTDQEQPLELILARNLVSIVSLPALLIDTDGQIVFYNEAAAEVVGSPFEELGTMTRAEWNDRFGPVDVNGDRLASDEIPLAVAVREGRPAYARLLVRGELGPTEVEAGALPLLGPAGYHGAMIFFWVAEEAGDPASLCERRSGVSAARSRFLDQRRHASAETPHACRSPRATARSSSSTPAPGSVSWEQ